MTPQARGAGEDGGVYEDFADNLAARVLPELRQRVLK